MAPNLMAPNLTGPKMMGLTHRNERCEGDDGDSEDACACDASCMCCSCRFAFEVRCCRVRLRTNAASAAARKTFDVFHSKLSFLMVNFLDFRKSVYASDSVYASGPPKADIRF